MPNNYPYYPRTVMESAPSQFMGIKGRPVSSLEEARATSIDFDGSIFYFPDLANKRIYTKQINLDGTATLNVYEYKQMPDPQKQTYITREEFESVIQQLRNNFLSQKPAEASPSERQTQPPQYNF